MSELRPLELLEVMPTEVGVTVEASVDAQSGSPGVRIPLPTTEGRDGFGPSLALVHRGFDPLSPFAFGWALSGLPSIDVDGREGVPAYDGDERARFAGQELVPLEEPGRPASFTRGEHEVRCYRPRIESEPMRVERWTHGPSQRVHWRVRRPDGSVWIFGRRSNGESRMVDPGRPWRTFRWLLEAAHDRLGNAMVVRYSAEDLAEIDPGSIDATRFRQANANRYPKRVLYGNGSPLREDDASEPSWHFEVVFDYGDHREPRPAPEPSHAWRARPDVAGTARPGFMVRTRRLCERLLMFHRFPDELGEEATLVGSVEFGHELHGSVTVLRTVRRVGYGGSVRETPPARFAYSTRDGDEAFERLPVPLLASNTEFRDLLGEGLPGLLTQDLGGVRFARNLGDGRFGAHELLPDWPVGLEEGTLGDFDGDGNTELVAVTGPNAGYFRLDRRTRRWTALQRFDATVTLGASSGAVRQVDLSGNGLPDVAVLHRWGITWFPNHGADGFGEPEEVRLDGERFPTTDLPLDRFLADMTGDGLVDVVEVLNGSVRYWPNLGRGHFGMPVLMNDAPLLDARGSFDAARVVFADLEGTGGADILYLRGDGAVLHAPNLRGVGFGPVEVLAVSAPIPNGAVPELTDPYGDGSLVLAWFEARGGTSWLNTLRLTSSPGAHRMSRVEHWLGATTSMEWGHSIRHYLRDVATGRGWETPLPQQRAVIDRIIDEEPVSGTRQSRRFLYRDGHYDPQERGFALFATVETVDADPDASGQVEPLLIRRFAHTGELDYSSRFVQHHYAGDLQARPPPESSIETASLVDRDHDLALRALTGSMVREELYAVGETGTQDLHPLKILESGASVRLTRAADDAFRTGVQVVSRVQLEANYERSAGDPRITFSRALEVDRYLQPLRTLEGALPGRVPRYPAQGRQWLIAAENGVTGFDNDLRFEPSIPVRSATFELHLPAPIDPASDDLGAVVAAVVAVAGPHGTPLDTSASTPRARDLTEERAYYWDDTRTAAAPLGVVGRTTLPHHEERAVYDDDILGRAFGGLLPSPGGELTMQGYRREGTRYFAPGPTTTFGPPERFHRLVSTRGFDGGEQRFTPDAHHLVAQSVVDEVGNATTGAIDYRILAPWRLEDANETVREVRYDELGVAIATSRRGSALDEAGVAQAHGFAPLPPDLGTFEHEDLLRAPDAALGGLESRFAYDYGATSAPARMVSLVAEQLADRGPHAGDEPSRTRTVVAYFDGYGRSVQERMRVEPGPAWTTRGRVLEWSDAEPERWLVSGMPVYDAKHQLIATFEPFFHTTASFELPVQLRRVGVAVVTAFDALEREVLQQHPNGTRVETRIEAWRQSLWDRNDSVFRAPDYRAARETLDPSAPERRALEQALRHADTPIHRHLDGLGRPFATTEVVEGAREVTERLDLDVSGNALSTTDRRGVVVSTREFDRLGRPLVEDSADAGRQHWLHDALKREVLTWHEQTQQRTTYDPAGRPVEVRVTEGSSSWIAERLSYGESVADGRARNQRGRVARIDDGAGRLEWPRYGAFGEVLEERRMLSASPGADLDWSSPVALESAPHITQQSFDAIGRRARALLPDGTRREETYLRSGPMARVSLGTPDGEARTIVEAADYDAHGRLLRRRLGNGVDVDFTYDPLTLRLYQRRAGVAGQAPFQDLRHHYDPVGNVVVIDDLAQRPGADRVLRGLSVDAQRVMSHDCRYRLIEASGRVHEGLLPGDYRGDTPNSGAFRGTRRLGLNDGGAVTRYRRAYTYDDADTLERWEHRPDGALPGPRWTVEKWVSATSNRSHPAFDLNAIRIANPADRFNARGQLERLPAVRRLEWSSRDELRRAVLVERSGEDDEELYDYAQDSRRVRKTTRRLVDGSIETSEVVTFDGCELSRVSRGGTILVERWSSHLAAGEERLATVHRWTTDRFARETDNVSSVREHFHLAGRLGSISIDVDRAGALLAYEEYFPYGRTAFVAGDAVREVRLRTLRYVGKNQDDATGFYVFQYRYYAPFIGNWVSPDPAGEVDGPNRYFYANDNPVTLADPSGLQTSADPEQHRWRENLYQGLREMGASHEQAAAHVSGVERDVVAGLERGDNAYLSVSPGGTTVTHASSPPTNTEGQVFQIRADGRITIIDSGSSEPQPHASERPLVIGNSDTAPARPPAPRRPARVRPQRDEPRDASPEPEATAAQAEPEAPAPELFDPTSRDDWGEVFGTLGEALGDFIWEAIPEALGEWFISLLPGGVFALVIKHVYEVIEFIDTMIETLPVIVGAVESLWDQLQTGTLTISGATALVAGALALVVMAAGSTTLGRRLIGFVRGVLDRLDNAARGVMDNLIPRMSPAGGAPLNGPVFQQSHPSAPTSSPSVPSGSSAGALGGSPGGPSGTGHGGHTTGSPPSPPPTSPRSSPDAPTSPGEPPQLRAPRTATEFRNTPGLATGAGLPMVRGRWLRGTHGNAGPFPGQVAQRLAGRSFRSFDEFREAFWRAVADTPELASQFGRSNRTRMARGLAPIAPAAQHRGGIRSYNLHHRQPIEAGGPVYDMHNLMIVSPRYHRDLH